MMKEEPDMDTLVGLVEEKIQLGKLLIKNLIELEEIDGVKKIQRNIASELKFLEKIKLNRTIKLNHILCSNLTHFESLIQSMFKRKNIKYVNYPLPLSDRESKLRIDIICDDGFMWVKVVARNPKSLSDSLHGRGSYGSKSILDQAEEYIVASQNNSYMFKNPKVVFEFTSQIEDDLVEALEDIGVVVEITGEVSTIDSNFECSDAEASEKDGEQETINLDITTLMAYVSSMTNGSCNWLYNETLLTEQAEWERLKPIKPILDGLLANKRLICCETAVNSFNEILTLLGGDGEKKRAAEFLERIEILPDITDVPPELSKLNKCGKKIKPRSLKIFGFGLQHKVLTMTANEGFYRSAKMQGIDVPVYLHEARALTEQKEGSAKLLVPSSEE